VPDGRAANQPFSVTTSSADGRAVKGACVSFAVMVSPASSVAVTTPVKGWTALASARRWLGHPYVRKPGLRTSLPAPLVLAGVSGVTAVISAANRSRMMPSLSVVQTVPSVRRNEAPALSSPPKPNEPSTRPSTEPFEAYRTSASRRPKSAATRSIIELETNVLPTAASGRQPGRC